MKSLQYTIRNIPREIDLKLREQAKEREQSLNQIVLDIITRALNPQIKQKRYQDLDWFCGSLDSQNTELDSTLSELKKLPNNLAKKIKDL